MSARLDEPSAPGIRGADVEELGATAITTRLTSVVIFSGLFTAFGRLIALLTTLVVLRRLGDPVSVAVAGRTRGRHARRD